MSLNTHTYYSNGKLLLTGEYVVLDGALSLALPSIYGQYLTVTKIKLPKIIWKSLDEKDLTWFTTIINTNSLKTLTFSTGNSIKASSNKEITRVLLKILKEAQKLNPSFLSDNIGYEITTKLTFPRNWGLGSSSTLINNIAQWAKVDAYELLRGSFPGSGYDIACAQYRQPVIYQLRDEKPVVRRSTFYPPFAPQLYFVHLNKKQSSSAGIHLYNTLKENKINVIKTLSNITKKIAITNHLGEFEDLMEEHETLIASLIKLPKIKEQLFSDYFGKIKSLGAWGGDFILATGNAATPGYFKRKGFNTIIPYDKMILNKL